MTCSPAWKNPRPGLPLDENGRMMRQIFESIEKWSIGLLECINDTQGGAPGSYINTGSAVGGTQSPHWGTDTTTTDRGTEHPYSVYGGMPTARTPLMWEDNVTCLNDNMLKVSMHLQVETYWVSNESPSSPDPDSAIRELGLLFYPSLLDKADPDAGWKHYSANYERDPGPWPLGIDLSYGAPIEFHQGSKLSLVENGKYDLDGWCIIDPGAGTYELQVMSEIETYYIYPTYEGAEASLTIFWVRGFASVEQVAADFPTHQPFVGGG